jgi:hypothetical protein
MQNYFFIDLFPLIVLFLSENIQNTWELMFYISYLLRIFQIMRVTVDIEEHF